MPQQATKPISYFLIFSIIGLFAALIGFGKTFFVPMAKGNLDIPASIHIHGAFAFGWVVLFVAQAFFIHSRNFRLHKKLGFLGLAFATGILVTLVPAGLFAVNRNLAKGVGDGAYSEIVGVITSGLLFFSLVIAGFVNRKKGSFHKRYLLLATIVVLWPAWFRFRHYFPSVPRPDIWFALVLADSLIIIAWIYEKIRFGRIHPVLLYGGILIIVEQTCEVLLFDTPTWRVVAKWVYNLTQ